MTRSIFFLAVIALCIATACDLSELQAPVPAQGITDTEIIIGSHSDLSGALDRIGTQSINAARMRFDEVNESGGIHGREIRFVVEDTRYRVPQAVSAAKKLITENGIFAMLLGLGTQQNNAIIPMLEQQGVPNLFPVSGARSMIRPFRELQFVARGIYYNEIQAGVRHFVNNHDINRPCIMYQDTDFGREILEGAERQLALLGLSPSAISAHEPTESHFDNDLRAMKAAACDLVLLGTINRDTVRILAAARRIGFEGAHWVGTNASYSQMVAAVADRSSEGYSVFSHIALIYRDDPDLPPEVAEWWDRYEERFGSPPDYAAMEGYRSADMLVTALEIAGRELDTKSLIRSLESLDHYTDLFGYTLTFGPGDHSGVDKSVMSTVVNGRWQSTGESVSY